MPTDIASPCCGICRISEERRLCEGCYRTLDEIAQWSTMNAEQKRLVTSTCQQRQQVSTNAADEPKGSWNN